MLNPTKERFNPLHWSVNYQLDFAAPQRAFNILGPDDELYQPFLDKTSIKHNLDVMEPTALKPDCMYNLMGTFLSPMQDVSEGVGKFMLQIKSYTLWVHVTEPLLSIIQGKDSKEYVSKPAFFTHVHVS